MKIKNIIALFKESFTEFMDDKAPRLGAALAYYTIFSIAPLLLIAIAVAGLVYGRQNAQHDILGQLKSVFGDAAAKSIQEMLVSAAKPKSGTIATVVGAITLLFGAAGVFGQLKDALNTIWNVEPKKGGGFMRMVKDRFLSFAMVFGIAFLLLVSLVLDAALSAASKYVGLPGGEAPWQILQLAVSFAVITVLFALIFRFLPDTHVEWRDVWYGAAFTSFLFVVGKFALGIYFGRSSVGSAYGAAGSLVLLLLWIYYSAQILFFGAEFTQVYARHHGSRKGLTEPSASQAAWDSRALRATSQPPAVSATTAKASSGKVKLVIGGLAGLFMGTILGGVMAVVAIFKSIRKLF
jgi:membrane protein